MLKRIIDDELTCVYVLQILIIKKLPFSNYNVQYKNMRIYNFP
jgi:hypothetical protein